MTFLTWCPPYLEWSGGSIALHTLVHLLAEKGHDSYVVGCHKSNKLKGGLISEVNAPKFLQEHPDAIMIYPEVVRGNPYGAKNVVRWLLHNPAITIGEVPDFPNETIFTYCDIYSEHYKERIEGTLTAFDLRIDSYTDKGQHIKGKTCYTIRKGTRTVRDKHPEDAVQILDYQDQQLGEDLIKIFDECETFICYDNNTFLCVHAALRGCNSIVIPEGNLTAEEWHNTAAYSRYGIAYGFDDMEYALSTRHLMKDYLRNYENESMQQLDNFIEICKNKYE